MNIKTLRLVGLLEGISFLLLLFIAMPVKYMMDNPILVKYIGMGHGVLFVLFLWCYLRSAKTEMVSEYVYSGLDRVDSAVWTIYL